MFTVYSTYVKGLLYMFPMFVLLFLLWVKTCTNLALVTDMKNKISVFLLFSVGEDLAHVYVCHQSPFPNSRSLLRRMRQPGCTCAVMQMALAFIFRLPFMK